MISAMYSDSLQQLRQKGVIDYESQASSLNTAYANSLEHGNTQAAEAIKKQMNILSVYGGKYVELSQKLQGRNQPDEPAEGKICLLQDKY